MTLRQKHFIDSHKGATSLFVVAVMAWTGEWNNVALWIYLALHGTYGALWMLKSAIFGDRMWERETGIAYGLVIWGGLSLYWISPWLIATRHVAPPPWYLAGCVSIYAFGVFFHFAADMQKHVQLSIAPGLITTGIFKHCRNPNYFGELLIYVGFSALAMHWIPLAALTLFVAAVWIPNMIKKDRSLSRYPAFAEYRKRSAMFIPFVI